MKNQSLMSNFHEFKFTGKPQLTKSMTTAYSMLKLGALYRLCLPLKTAEALASNRCHIFCEEPSRVFLQEGHSAAPKLPDFADKSQHTGFRRVFF